MLEIEAKIRVDGHQAVRERLKELGAVYVGRYVETNHILDRTDGLLRGTGRGLRVRTMETLQGEPASPTLTYKGPILAGELKRREEVEIEVADAAKLLDILHATDFETVVGYRKRRERWMLGGCHVELDEVPLLGTFVEIEGPDEKTIRAVQRSLGLGGAAHETHSYVGLLAERCEALGRSTLGIDFE